ncbi:hypothetical protein [Actinokineospora iranica]|uniref:Uncharacterized protein n=1 Tax=Actinokineospora iranica TaxID=1271860 RepID=A0A1G6P775_9PSEU|nr:hypothetical protein [Actinokineospora iranica]SDC75848.1 hypothetical protein SAMN05216174_104146 [Actinokineospora iranica]
MTPFQRGVITWFEYMAVVGPLVIAAQIALVVRRRRNTMPPLPLSPRWRARRRYRRRAALSSRATGSASPLPVARPHTPGGAGTPDPAPPGHRVETPW